MVLILQLETPGIQPLKSYILKIAQKNTEQLSLLTIQYREIIVISVSGHTFLLYFLIAVHYILLSGYSLPFSKIHYTHYFCNMLVENRAKVLSLRYFTERLKHGLHTHTYSITHLVQHSPEEGKNLENR